MTQPIAIDQVPRLIIIPCKKSGPVVAVQTLGPTVWVFELSFTEKELLEAAFRFAMWLVSQFGTKTFDLDWHEGANQAEGVGSATADRATAQDRILQALYHLGRQEFAKHMSPRAQRAAKTLFWLYNTFSYGRERARGDRLQWPDEHPELPRHASGEAEQEPMSPAELAGARLVGESHRAYTTNRLEEAEQLLEQAHEAGVPSTVAHKASWLAGMIAYRQGRFAQALTVFPEPSSNRQDKWWRRDQLMLARLHARAGSPSRARELLSILEPLSQWRDRAFPIEYFGVAAITALRDNRENDLQSAISNGLALLGGLRMENKEREDRHLIESSTIHPQTVQMGVFDLVAALAAKGNTSEAIHHLTKLGGFDGWELDYLASDGLLAAIFGVPENVARLASWLKQERGY